MKNDSKFITICIILFFLIAVSSVYYFIWSDTFIEEYDSDSAESVIWARACIESKSLINPDFNYIYALPFSNHIFLIPFVKHFGDGIPAHRIGVTIQASLFFVLVLLFFKSLKYNTRVSFFYSSIVILSLCSTKYLRQLFWVHIIYYSLAIIFLSAAFFLKEKSENDHAHSFVYIIGLFFVFFTANIDGLPVTAMFTLPFLFAYIAEPVLRNDKSFLKKNKKAIIIMLISSFLGILINKLFISIYESSYSDEAMVISNGDKWIPNFSKILTNWLSLFLKMPENNIPFFSIEGICLVIRIFAGLLFFLVLFISPFLYNHYTESERFITLITWAVSVEILFCYAFGNISNRNWRMVPMYFMCIVQGLLIISTLKRLPDNNVLSFRLIGNLISCFAVVFAIICGVSTFCHKINTDRWFAKDSVLNVLNENGLYYGYSLDFWNGNALTVISNGVIKSRPVRYSYEDDQIKPGLLQTDDNWYKEQNYQGKTFLICQENEAAKIENITKDAINTIHVSQPSFYDNGIVGLIIYVFDYNIMTAKNY